ncbi:hypothetical protein [Caenispirillum salinarum]|uniref:hypothetical protein n=1 Tax=Caenispirillum salinarum TaxID=859058 RepID=UPI0005BB251F|nr:hypothetical protein [Caenispirillum salinarum]
MLPRCKLYESPSEAIDYVCRRSDLGRAHPLKPGDVWSENLFLNDANLSPMAIAERALIMMGALKAVKANDPVTKHVMVFSLTPAVTDIFRLGLEADLDQNHWEYGCAEALKRLKAAWKRIAVDLGLSGCPSLFVVHRDGHSNVRRLQGIKDELVHMHVVVARTHAADRRVADQKRIVNRLKAAAHEAARAVDLTGLEEAKRTKAQFKPLEMALRGSAKQVKNILDLHFLLEPLGYSLELAGRWLAARQRGSGLLRALEDIHPGWRGDKLQKQINGGEAVEQRHLNFAARFGRMLVDSKPSQPLLDAYIQTVRTAAFERWVFLRAWCLAGGKLGKPAYEAAPSVPTFGNFVQQQRVGAPDIDGVVQVIERFERFLSAGARLRLIGSEPNRLAERDEIGRSSSSCQRTSEEDEEQAQDLPADAQDDTQKKMGQPRPLVPAADPRRQKAAKGKRRGTGK